LGCVIQKKYISKLVNGTLLFRVFAIALYYWLFIVKSAKFAQKIIIGVDTK